MKKDDQVSRTQIFQEDGKPDYTYTLRGKVMWVIDNEASIQDSATGMFTIVNLDEEKDWVVEVSADPTYQSTVINMTEEQLRQSIEDLRNNRQSAPKVIKRQRGAIMKKDPIADALAKLSPEKREALKRKLGLTD